MTITITAIAIFIAGFIISYVLFGWRQQVRAERFENQMRDELKALGMMIGKESEEWRNHDQQQDGRLHDIEDALNMYHPHEVEQMSRQNGLHSDEAEIYDPDDYSELTSRQRANLGA